MEGRIVGDGERDGDDLREGGIQPRRGEEEKKRYVHRKRKQKEKNPSVLLGSATLSRTHPSERGM